MTTFFTIPKAFLGDAKISQTNAIASWKKYNPNCNVVIFGDEIGNEEISVEKQIKQVKNVKSDRFGVPLIADAIELVQSGIGDDCYVYINTDIILLTNIESVLDEINLRDGKYVLVGRRIDLDVDDYINFDDVHDVEDFLKKTEQLGRLHGYSGIDYLIFSNNTIMNLPPFTVGRPGWDNWLLYYCYQNRIPTYDCTKIVTAVHQNHKSKYNWGQASTYVNIDMIDDLGKLHSIRDTEYIIDEIGVIKSLFSKRLRRFIRHTRLANKMFAIKRNIVNERRKKNIVNTYE